MVDNAKIHVADEILEELTEELTSSGVEMRTLPTYSPELNPCELVFGLMKSHLRRYRGDSRFQYEIIRAAAVVTYAQVVMFYHHCVNQESVE